MFYTGSIKLNQIINKEDHKVREITINKRSLKYFLFFTIIFGLCLTPICVNAQDYGKISGKVTEVTSGSYLPGANVIIMNTVIGTAADLQGRYTISKIVP